jgi:phytoene synthase
MTSPPDRSELVAEAGRIISSGSRSFRFASRLFDRPTRERAWLLYAWCRACDDLADGQVLGRGFNPGTDPAERIATIRRLTAAALSGERTGQVPFDCLGVVAAECGIPDRFIADHIEGFALDADGWRPNDHDDLLLYCYRVAGAVGCMMAMVMGVRQDDEDTLRRAADLGIAFQLANIARDIVEDEGMGRLYLPRTWLAEAGLDEENYCDRANRPALAALAQRLSTLSDVYQASARVGAARLRGRSRWAVLSAANIYGDIARRVVARGPEAWDSRTFVGKAAKLRHVGGALVAALRQA